MLKLDNDLYTELLSFRSTSRSFKQIEFREWLIGYINTEFKNVVTEIDSYGNLYVTKGSDSVYNCVVAHLDINQKTKVSDPQVIYTKNWVLGFDESTGQQVGLGHDDKAGVLFCLKALKKFDNIKAFFALDEELGCLGSKQASGKFFEDVGFLLQLDRRGFGDVSYFTNGVQVLSKDTQKEFKHILDKHSHTFRKTVYTDIGVLCDMFGIQGTNVSCGYYNEHSDSEVLNISEFDKACEFAMELLEYTEGRAYRLNRESEAPQSSGQDYNPFDNYTNFEQVEDFVHDFLCSLDGFMQDSDCIELYQNMLDKLIDAKERFGIKTESYAEIMLQERIGV